MIGGWECRQLWQYFDFSGRAVARNAEEIAKLQAETRKELYARMSEAVNRFIRDFSGTPEEFCRLVGTAVNDLYRTVSAMPRYTDRHTAYLTATARPMMDALAKRGIVVHFGTACGLDPSRPKSDILVARKFWNDCGFFFFETVSYPDRNLALRHIAGRVKEIRSSYVMMIPEGNKTDFRPLYDSVGSQGVMTFFRNQPPEDPAFKTYPFRFSDARGKGQAGD